MENSTPSTPASGEPINRREFLYYVWAASAALLLAESGAGIAWYLSPYKQRKETLIKVDLPALLESGDVPVRQHPKVWLSNTPSGLFAFHNICTHLGCTVRWIPTRDRFECPCHGAKFKRDGAYIEGPAYRSMDSLQVRVNTPDGIRTTPKEGGPVSIKDATAIEVDLQVYIYGQPRD
jgi:cytochrome b6-f complex iron-sulfur subunit